MIAIQFLTRLPTPRVTVTGEAFAQSMRWFPAVGLIVGVLVAAAAWAGAQVDPWVASLLALLTWVGVTGGLHLDGLGDIADATGAAHKDRDRLLAVLADPHLGSFGAIAIALQLAAKLVLGHAMVEAGHYEALALVPFAARIGPLLWTRILPSLHDGLGARFRGAVRPVDLAIWGALLLLAAIAVSPAMLVAPVLMLLWAAWLRSRIGGISGDGHGGGIEVVETALMLAVLCAAAPR